MYRQNARRDYLNLAKCKKRTAKKIRKAIKQQLQYIRRNRGYLEALLETECELAKHQTERLAVIDKVYELQKFMYDNKVHSVSDMREDESSFPGQIGLLDDETDDRIPELIEPEEIEVKSYKKSKKAKAAYEEQFENLPSRQVPLDTLGDEE